MVVTSTSCVMYCHVTSDILGKDLAWCHLGSLWSRLTLSSLGEKKKKKDSSRKTLGKKPQVLVFLILETQGHFKSRYG